jgi:cellulose biosynthesis protein BcsQ
MKTLAVVNQKGGCGKTTVAVNVAACLAAGGERVLLVDMDPQGHAGGALGVDTDHLEDGSDRRCFIRYLFYRRATDFGAEHLAERLSNTERRKGR